MVVVLLGIIRYAFLKARRERLGQVAAPIGDTAVKTAGQSPAGLAT